MPTIKEILMLESSVWEALRIGDPEADAKLLSEDFLGVYPTGFSTREDHCKQLENGPVVLSYELLNPRLIIFSNELVLLSYLANWVPYRSGKIESSKQMYVSSIWKYSGNEWKNIFSQDTDALTI